VYPNPTHGKFMVDMALVEKQNVVMTIISSSGQVVRKYKFDDVEKLRESIDLSGMAEGLYNLRINAGDKYYTRQIVVR
ncbi:MAG: T9SS type A sorting domain-containing protein, partial [Bacteroidales bacterium]